MENECKLCGNHFESKQRHKLCENCFTEMMREQYEDEIKWEENMKPKITFGEYQLCPRCNGQKTVSKPPYLSGDIHEWSSTQTSFQCGICKGVGMILRPIIANNPK